MCSDRELPIGIFASGFGGLTVALARAFKILDPKVKNPQSVHWERAMAIFDLLF